MLNLLLVEQYNLIIYFQKNIPKIIYDIWRIIFIRFCHFICQCQGKVFYKKIGAFWSCHGMFVFVI